MVRVLVPLDGSERSLDAMEKGLEKLRAAKPHVTLLVVMQDGFETAGEDRIAAFEADADDEIFPTEASSHAAFREAQRRLTTLGVTAQTKTARGRVRTCIVDESAHHDILLMHGLPEKSILAKLRMSNTLWLARNARCSVLLQAD